jgi:CHASE2 domain-containing sensor protein
MAAYKNRRTGFQVIKQITNWRWPRTFWTHIRKSVPSIVSALPLTVLLLVILNSVMVFRAIERPIQDALSRILSSPDDSEVAIVRITQADYNSLFQAKSPLNPETLKQLIDAIARAGPKAIGIDIDTSSAEFQSLNPSPDWPPIVWARDARYSNKNTEYYLSGMLGGTGKTALSGAVFLVVDDDEVVRRYKRFCKTDEGLVPTFVWELLSQSHPDKTRDIGASADEMFIKYAGKPGHSYRIDLPASEVLSLATNSNWAKNNIIKNKIVLLGGDYAAQDEHQTPLGWMAGVEVLAQTLETEVAGGGIRPASKIASFLCMIVTAFALWFLYQYFSLRLALLLSALAIPFLSLACSFLLYQSPSQAIYFFPVLMAVLGAQLYERFKDPFPSASNVRTTASSKKGKG